MILFVNDTSMRFGTAFKKALKYHAVASLPTLVGGAIVAVALWIGLIEPALASVGGAIGGPQQLLQAVIAAPINIPVLVVGVVGGLVIRRVGRTTLLFRIHGTGVVNTVERDIGPDQAPTDRSASDDQSTERDSAANSSTTATTATASGGTVQSATTSDDGESAEGEDRRVEAGTAESDDEEGSDDEVEAGSDDDTATGSDESEPRTER